MYDFKRGTSEIQEFKVEKKDNTKHLEKAYCNWNVTLFL